MGTVTSETELRIKRVFQQRRHVWFVRHAGDAVVYAQKYARLVFDKALHDRLLHQIIDAKVDVADMTLINTIAKSRAAELLAESDEYF